DRGRQARRSRDCGRRSAGQHCECAQGAEGDRQRPRVRHEPAAEPEAGALHAVVVHRSSVFEHGRSKLSEPWSRTDGDRMPAIDNGASRVYKRGQFRVSIARANIKGAEFMSHRRWVACLAIAFLSIAAPSVSYAQRTAGTISGTVMDTTGAVLPGVTVTAVC